MPSINFWTFVSAYYWATEKIRTELVHFICAIGNRLNEAQWMDWGFKKIWRGWGDIEANESTRMMRYWDGSVCVMCVRQTCHRWKEGMKEFRKDIITIWQGKLVWQKRNSARKVFTIQKRAVQMQKDTMDGVDKRRRRYTDATERQNSRFYVTIVRVEIPWLYNSCGEELQELETNREGDLTDCEWARRNDGWWCEDEK